MMPLIRSVSSDEIEKLEAHLRRVVEIAVREENSQRAMSGTSLSCGFEQAGDRPSGETLVGSPIVRAAQTGLTANYALVMVIGLLVAVAFYLVKIF